MFIQVINVKVLSGLCDVASFHPDSDCTICGVVLAQQLHLQEIDRASPESSEIWTQTSEEKRN